MLPARFTRTFILVVVVLVLFSSLLLVLNTPSLAIRRPSSSSSYFDPNRGLVFDSDGVEKDIAVDQNKKKPWIVGGGGGGEKRPLQVEGAHGGVIMSRLGNATAKYVNYIILALLSLCHTNHVSYFDTLILMCSRLKSRIGEGYMEIDVSGT